MNVNVCLFPERVTVKPKDWRDFATINNAIAKNEYNGSITQIAKAVGELSYPMTCATFMNGQRKDKNLKSIQLFGLDFDNKPEELVNRPILTIESIVERCRLFHLPISFAYETLSSRTVNGIPKYRVIFCHYAPITNLDTARLILRLLMKVFPEADPACKDVCRLYLGGKCLVYLDENAIFRLDDLAYMVQTHMKAIDPAHFSRDVRNLVKGTEIGISDNNFLSIFSNSMPVGEKEDDCCFLLNPQKLVNSPPTLFYI